MTRELSQGKRTALLTTGDEIISGDILNTNSCEIARALSDASMLPGKQISVPDCIHDIEYAIKNLLTEHDALIITGGLGPTSDDLTRFALAKALDLPLIFDETTWNNIAARLRYYGYPTPPESNRQQALFPLGAILIQNPAGTAAGCILKKNNKIIFMLPGPPNECMPMVDHSVLPTLREAKFNSTLFHKRWLLFGVSEGQIAEKLDQIAFEGGCKTGYRICYPYVEFKLYADTESDLLHTTQKILTIITPWLVDDGTYTASVFFLKTFQQSSKKISLCDEATGGLLESTLKTPDTYRQLTFRVNPASADILVQGLDAFWSQQTVSKTTLHLSFPTSPWMQDIHTEVTLRGPKIRLYATEWVALQMSKWLFNN